MKTFRTMLQISFIATVGLTRSSAKHFQGLGNAVLGTELEFPGGPGSSALLLEMSPLTP